MIYKLLKKLNQNEMSTKKQIAIDQKKEKSLIESVIGHSKEILLTKEAMRNVRRTKALYARLKATYLSNEHLTKLEQESRRNIQELELAISTSMKKKYNSIGLKIPDNFHFSSTDLQLGYCIMFTSKRVIKNGKSFPKETEVVLFLSDNKDEFLEEIKAGDIKPYTEVKNRLNKCKSVFDKNFIDTILQNCERTTLVLKKESIDKIKKTNSEKI